MRRMTGLTFMVLILVLMISNVVFAQGEEYTVEYGDTLDVIAASVNASVACIAEASGLTDPHSLRPGDTLVIPADCPPYDGLFIFFPPDEDDTEDQGGGSSTSGQGGGTSDGTYTVQYGDVIDLIAQEVNANVTCIAEASGLADFNTIRPGDTLVIPSNCPPYDGLFIQAQLDDDDADQGGGGTTTSGQGGGVADDGTYTIRYGDVIDLIAQEFNISVTCIAETSGIADFNKIRPGDTIVIDSGCPPYDGLFIQPEVEAEEPPAQG